MRIILVSVYIVETSPALYLQRFSYTYTGSLFDDGCRDTFVNASYKLDVTTVSIQTLQAYVTIGGGDAATTMALSVEDAARGAINTVSFAKKHGLEILILKKFYTCACLFIVSV